MRDTASKIEHRLSFRLKQSRLQTFFSSLLLPYILINITKKKKNGQENGKPDIKTGILGGKPRAAATPKKKKKTQMCWGIARALRRLGFKIMLIFLNVPHSASFPQARLKIANKQTAIINSIERAVRDVNAEQQSRIGRWAKRGGFGGAVEGQQVPHHSSINAKTKITNTNTGTCPQQKTITTALPVQKVTYN